MKVIFIMIICLTLAGCRKEAVPAELPEWSPEPPLQAKKGLQRPLALEEPIEIGISDTPALEIDWGAEAEPPASPKPASPSPKPTTGPTPAPLPVLFPVHTPTGGD